MRTVTLIPGDGTGPELIEQVLRVLDAAGAQIAWDRHELNTRIIEQSIEKHQSPLPPEIVRSFEHTKVMFKGPITTPIGKGFRSVNVEIRKRFGLYANIRPCQYMPGVKTFIPNVDLVIVRENTEDLYAGIEFLAGGVPVSMKVITRDGTSRIAHAAFKFADRHGRKKVTVVTKANIMKLTDGLFLSVCQEIAQYYPTVVCNSVLVDAMAMKLVRQPHEYDVLLCPNLYGDILSDLCAGLIGGLGIAPGANLGDEYAMFEAVHGSSPEHAGKNEVNPTALILASCLMLEHIGDATAAVKIRTAVKQVIGSGDPSKTTYDLGGSAGTREMADAIIASM